MTVQYNLAKISMGFAFLTLLICAVPAAAQLNDSPSPYLSFSDWPLVKLKGGMLVCTPYQDNQHAFVENFDDEQKFNERWFRHLAPNPVQGGFHGGTCGAVFLPENVQLIPSAPNSSDKYLALNAKLEVPPVTITGYDNGPPGQPAWPCLPAGVQNITRGVSAAAIHMKEPYKFNLGKYEIQCKFPHKDNVWSAFWMWHHDEIDIFDIGYYKGVIQASFHGNHTAALHDSPCCTYMKNCDFCDDIVDYVDCSSATGCGECDEQAHQEVPWGCTYLADGNWHTIGCEWTPYKVMFYVDGVVTGTVYRYYYPDKTPVIIECGGEIPEAVVRENPAFPDIEGRYFQPMVWITAEGIETCPGPICTNPEDLPATLLVKEISIRERAYQSVALTGCFDLCESGKFCLDFKSEDLNGLYGSGHGGFAHVDPIPKPILGDCQLLSNSGGSGTIKECGKDNQVCLEYNTAGCEDPGNCLSVSVDLGYPTPPLQGTRLVKRLKPQKTQIFSQCSNTTVSYREEPAGLACVCIDPGTTCNYNVTYGGVTTDLKYEDGLKCISINDPCAVIDVYYEQCGEPQFYSYNVATKGVALEAMKTPHMVTSYGSTPITNFTNFITTSSFDFCYLYDEVQIVHAEINIDGVTQILNFPSGRCLDIDGINKYAVVTIQFAIEGCGYFEKRYLFINRKRAFKLFPNPTDAAVVLEVDLTPLNFGEEGEFVPHPDYLLVKDLNNITIGELDLKTGGNSFQFDLSGQPAGNYQFLVKDLDLSAPINFSIQKY